MGRSTCIVNTHSPPVLRSTCTANTHSPNHFICSMITYMLKLQHTCVCEGHKKQENPETKNKEMTGFPFPVSFTHIDIKDPHTRNSEEKRTRKLRNGDSHILRIAKHNGKENQTWRQRTRNWWASTFIHIHIHTLHINMCTHSYLRTYTYIYIYITIYANPWNSLLCTGFTSYLGLISLFPGPNT